MKKLKEVLHFAADCDHIKIYNEMGKMLSEEEDVADVMLPNYEVIVMRYDNDQSACTITVNTKLELTLGCIMDYLSGNVIILNRYLDEIGMIKNNGEEVIRGDGKDGNLAEEPVYDIRAVGNKVYVVVRG